MRRCHAAALAMELLTLIKPLSLTTQLHCFFQLNPKYYVYELFTVDVPKVTARCLAAEPQVKLKLIQRSFR